MNVEDDNPETGDEIEEPLTASGTIADVARGLIALLLFSVGVLALYVAGGIVFGFLAWAAPAVLVMSAVILLARYLSRNK